MATPQHIIFDRNLVALRRKRAQKQGGLSFLLTRCAQDAAERLLDINRNFDRALFIGDVRASRAVLGALPDDKVRDVTFADHLPNDQKNVRAIDEEHLPYEAPEFDLIVSLLTLHHCNDLPGALVQFRRALKPDGVMIAAIFGGQTLTELRGALYGAETQIYGGITPRIAPFADYSQAANLLQRAGYALPVIDSDRVRVNYRSPMRLLSDLRDLGETNALTQRSRKPVSRAFIAALMSHYALLADKSGNHPATFEMLWLTGWAPHESQQKPLKPGSAKTRLADALGVEEIKL
ncbi:methyltransferase domain-containing protein [Robiginitomaculum antarcticum]|uniref:methyltransferase domain-containing protein n=1 Tax=Robiginitomaculum antarcticum TaxID=437507 RepID=UPI0004779105|nr:methyltransferase domain-containing protein [Robiginitomaculum antarcticum]